MQKDGLGVVMAACFLAGEMAGSGVLAMPAAMIGTGYYGLLFIIVFTVNACYTGSRLGECWVILEERHPEFRGIIRDPYPTIGEKTVGMWGR
jgi:vesicular inhibitory amino acid transporter